MAKQQSNHTAGELYCGLNLHAANWSICAQTCYQQPHLLRINGNCIPVFLSNDVLFAKLENAHRILVSEFNYTHCLNPNSFSLHLGPQLPVNLFPLVNPQVFCFMILVFISHSMSTIRGNLFITKKFAAQSKYYPNGKKKTFPLLI